MPNKKNWGIVVIGVLMLFVTILTIKLSGQKTSFYIFVWLLVAYYGYKGDLRSIKEWMKWLIFINLGVLFFIIIFANNTTIAYLANSQMELALGVVIMAIPKIILFYYCHFQLNKVLNIQKPNISSPTNSFKNLTHEMQTNITSQHINLVTDKKNEEQIYLQIYEELENKTFDKALWIRLFAETDGDENKTKVQYVRARFSILNSTKQQTSKVIVETNINNDYVSAPKEISINSIDNFAYYPFEQSIVIDTEKKFNVDREIAKKILLLGIKKYHGGFLYKQQSFHSFKNLTFGTLDAAIKYAEKNPST